MHGTSQWLISLLKHGRVKRCRLAVHVTDSLAPHDHGDRIRVVGVLRFRDEVAVLIDALRRGRFLEDTLERLLVVLLAND